MKNRLIVWLGLCMALLCAADAQNNIGKYPPLTSLDAGDLFLIEDVSVNEYRKLTRELLLSELIEAGIVGLDAATYDPGGVQEQLVGENSAQVVGNKTMDSVTLQGAVSLNNEPEFGTIVDGMGPLHLGSNGITLQDVSQILHIRSGTSPQNSGALLDLGVLTTVERDAVASSPTFGMLVANSTTGDWEYYTGAAWVSLGSGSGDMPKAVYDPGNISEQLVGENATQNLGNKTLQLGTISGGLLFDLQPDVGTVAEGTGRIHLGINGTSMFDNGQVLELRSGSAPQTDGAIVDLGSMTTTIRDGIVLSPSLGMLVANSTTQGLEAWDPLASSWVNLLGFQTANAHLTDLSDGQLTGTKVETFDGDAGSGGTSGAVPAPASGDFAAGYYLDAGGNWSAPTSGGLGTNLSSSTNNIDSNIGNIILGGTGGTNNENLKFDFETSADTIVLTSSSLATLIDMSAFDVNMDELALSGDLSASTLTVTSGTAPANVTEGRYQWDTDDDELIIGDGTSTVTMAKRTDHLGVFGATTSAQLASVLSEENGTGDPVFDTNPTIEEPNINDGVNSVQLSLNGDRIFHDTDSDGTQDPGEEFIDQVGGGGGSGVESGYGEISVAGNATTTTFSAASTDFSNKTQVLVFDTNGISNNTTPDHTNDHITIDNTTKYQLTAHISFSGGTSDTYSFAFFKNNGATQIGKRFTRKMGTGGDVGVASFSTVANLSATDTVELWCQNEIDTSALTVEDGCVIVSGLTAADTAPEFIVNTVDDTVSAATQENVDEMSFSADANTDYLVEFQIYSTADGTNGVVAISFDIPAGATIQGIATGHSANDSALTDDIVADDALTSDLGSGNEGHIHGMVRIAVGGTAGTVQLRHAELNAIRTITFEAGSWLKKHTL